MQYDFNKIFQRRGSCSMKWDSQPDDVLPMWVADSDFQSPPAVAKAIRKRIASGVFGYTWENDAFAAAYASWMGKRFGWAVAPEWVRWVPSLGTALALAIRAFTEPGENVVFQTPMYPPFANLCKLNGRIPTPSSLVQAGGTYRIDFADLEQKLANPAARLLLLCNPHNPTGRAFTEEELLTIGNLCLKHGVTIFSDEIHCDFVFRGRHIPMASLTMELANITVTGLNGSKTFNIADLRSAAVVASNPTLLRAMTDELDKSKLGRCSLGIEGIIAAYTFGEEYADQLCAYVQANIDHAVSFLRANAPTIACSKPDATFMLWLDCRDLPLKGVNPATFFLERGRLALNDGATFGETGQGFVRMNLACPRCLVDDGLGRIVRALESCSP